jgi:NAD(P)-dependent dehydrogenase (short-subunit alcohol dehydrogenase family)
MYGNLNGKVALVTGGSKGIGLAIAERFLIEKSKVCSISRHKPEKPNEDIIYFECDVSSEKSVKETNRTIRETVGPVDILVNNAGIENYAPVASTSVKMWDNIMNVNVKGAFLMSREVIPDMLKKGKGVIINIASVQSFASSKNAAAYVTSKHALIGLTKSIAVDYTPHIRSVSVCPATIRTPLADWAASLEVGNDKDKIEAKYKEWGSSHVLGRIGFPDEVASIVAFLSSDEASFITGSSFLVDGGMLSRIPISTPEV